MACGPKDAHTVGLEALATVLGNHCWDCPLLGAHTGVAALTAAIPELDPAVVVVVSDLSSGRRQRSICSVPPNKQV